MPPQEPHFSSVPFVAGKGVSSSFLDSTALSEETKEIRSKLMRTNIGTLI